MKNERMQTPEKKKSEIICIVGKSASGKDSICKALVDHVGLKPIIPCTTRPMRENESELNPYHFIKENDVEKEMIGKTVFHTVYGSWYYGFCNQELDKTQNHIAVANPEQVCEICSRYGAQFKIRMVYIMTDEEERIIHAIKREDATGRKYEELCRRIKSDAHDFSESNEMFRKAYLISDYWDVIYNDYKMTPKEIAIEYMKKRTMKRKERE